MIVICLLLYLSLDLISAKLTCEVCTLDSYSDDEVSFNVKNTCSTNDINEGKTQAKDCNECKYEAYFKKVSEMRPIVEKFHVQE